MKKSSKEGLKKSSKRKTKKISEKEEKKEKLKGLNTRISIFYNLSAIAFILFLITVWPDLGQEVVNLGWGWYLGLMIAFILIAAKEHMNLAYKRAKNSKANETPNSKKP